jgi:hypothetical protein
MTKKTSTLKLITAIVCCSFIYGCATPASPIAMTVSRSDLAERTTAESKHLFEVRNVSGGQETNPLWTSQVDNTGFRDALTQSLSNLGFSPANTSSKFSVDAELQALSQPLFGLDFSVTSTVRYTVEGNGQRKLYPVTATGTATMSDAFVGAERLRKANEKSIKENIKEFLKLLSLDFDK